MKSSSYAMEGEDIILASLLRDSEHRTFLDIGSSEPIENSNTYYFYKKGWRGVAVDGRDLAADWERARPGDLFVRSLLGDSDGGSIDYWIFPDPTMNTADADTAARYASRFSEADVKLVSVPVRRGYDVYQEVGGRPDRGSTCAPEIVSVDVEGFEIPVLKGLLEPDRGWRPAVLVVETKLFNFLRPLEHDIVDYLVGVHCYALVAKTPLNAFFVDPANSCFNWMPSSMLESN